MLAAALALGSTGQLGGAAVCVGFDVHVDVDSSLCTCCIVTSSHDGRVHSGLAPAIPSCDGCVDVQLRVSPLRSKEIQLSTSPLNAEGRTFALSCGAGCRNHLLVPADDMDQHWQCLSTLSTVVLLT